MVERCTSAFRSLQISWTAFERFASLGESLQSFAVGAVFDSYWQPCALNTARSAKSVMC